MNRDKKTGGLFQPQSLEIDEGIFDRNLKIIPDLLQDEGNSSSKLRRPEKSLVLPGQPEQGEEKSKVVTPDPGFCVKTKSISGGKVFLNLCRICEIIPPAKPITEEQLQKIIAEEDYSSDYRVPMSLGAPRPDTDKSGGPCLICDVALNSAWFEDTLENSITFTTFVVHIAMEGLCENCLLYTSPSPRD